MRLIDLGCLAAVIVGLASPSWAARMVATYEGDVTYLVDPANVFGLGADYLGAHVTAAFVYDTEVGGRHILTPFSELREDLGAGPGPVVAATLRVNDAIHIVQDLSSSSVLTYAPDYFPLPYGYLGHSIYNYNAPDDFNSFGVYSFASAPARLDLPFASMLSELDQDYGNGGWEYRTPDAYFYLGFAARYVTVTRVPEPSTWALLTGGFAISGAAIRRGRRRGLHPCLRTGCR